MKNIFFINIFLLICCTLSFTASAKHFMCSKKLVHQSIYNYKFILKVNEDSIQKKQFNKSCFEKTKSSKCIIENNSLIEIPLIYKDSKDYKDIFFNASQTNIYRQTSKQPHYGDKIYILSFNQCPETCRDKSNDMKYGYTGKELDCMALPENQNTCATFTQTNNSIINAMDYDKYREQKAYDFLDVSKCKLIK